MSTRGPSRGRGGRGRGSDIGATPRGRGQGRAGSPAQSTASGPRGRGFAPPRGRGGPPSGPIIYQENVPARVPSQLEPSTLKRLIESFKAVKVSAERPLRPGYGTVGNPINLRTNFFAVKIRKSTFYDYVVTIEPKSDVRRIKARLFKLLEQTSALRPHQATIAHDGAQRLISANPLPQPLDIPVQFYDDDERGPGPKAKVYTVSITLEREFDSTELDKSVSHSHLIISSSLILSKVHGRAAQFSSLRPAPFTFCSKPCHAAAREWRRHTLREESLLLSQLGYKAAEPRDRGCPRLLLFGSPGI